MKNETKQLQGTHEGGVSYGRFILNDGKRTEDNKRQSIVDDVDVLDLFNESHRLFKGKVDDVAIRR